MKPTHSKYLFYLASFTFIVLIIFSYVFFLERSMLLDLPFHLFTILAKDDYTIQNYRYIALLTESVPLLLSKFDISLKTITICYSMSFALLYFLVFLFIYKVMRNEKIAIAFFLYNIVMYTHTFYWPVTELHQGIAFLFILIALLENICISDSELTIIQYFSILGLIIIISFAHPLLIFSGLFSIAFLLLNYKSKYKFLLSIAILITIGFLAKNILLATSHDNSSMSGIKNIITYFPHYKGLQSNKNLLKYILHDYYFIPILYLLITYYYFKQKNILKFSLLTLSLIAYTFIVNITYPNGADEFYLENQYMQVGLFISLAFVYEIYHHEKITYSISILFSIISILGLYRIYDTHKIYESRNHWYRKTIAQLGDKKTIITSNKIPKDTVIMTWAVSNEFWLLSTIENNKTSSINIEEYQNEFDNNISKKDVLITRWESFNYSKLNPTYFILKDTSTSYIKN